MGGVLVALAAAAALLFVRRRRRRRGGPGPGSEQGDDGGSESPKVGAMEQGLHSSADLLGLPKSGEANGYNLAVAAGGWGAWVPAQLGGCRGALVLTGWLSARKRQAGGPHACLPRCCAGLRR